MNSLRLLFSSLFFLLFQFEVLSQNNYFFPGKVWNDVDGNPINAHGGGILYDKGIYYWFGEIKSGKTIRVTEDTSWENYRVDAGGISCYSSNDLIHWKYQGVALAPEKSDSTSDLYIGNVIERPKVIYNEKTKQYVMWMHIDKRDYSYARAGIAVSNTVAGPYTFLGSTRPNGEMSRDMTLYKDDNGKAYQVCSSENNQTMHINELTDDYLKPTGNYKRILIGTNREAPAIVKHNNKYYLITSLCTGWDPNAALYAIADSMMGDWQMKGNPCVGKGSSKTFQSQSTYILPVEGKKDTYIFMADKWNKTDLPDSRYVWLPLVFKNDQPVIKWYDQWKLK
jgi:Glycosyl hydrolases family 43